VEPVKDLATGPLFEDFRPAMGGLGTPVALLAMAYKLIDALYLPRALSARANASSTVPTASTVLSSAL